MTGIPGSAGAAVYGNAGAYGHSIAERISRVRFFDGSGVREFDNAQCEFHYRESVFKQHKEWIIFSAELAMERGDAASAAGDRGQDPRHPQQEISSHHEMRGQYFQKLSSRRTAARVANEIPANVIIEGKVPSAWFLEQVGAKGMRAGDIQVADYHANLIYNDGQGTARDLVGIIAELKQRVERRWGIPLEEEVQYVGFPRH